ncbi:MAG: GntR family transcriptional regulator [Lachnospiraceae bacterium]|nr:GntR family transcriptional regulator [Lachnospiraceae bacterium]
MHTSATSLKNQIYTSISNDISLGVYPPDHVFNEKGLMEQFNVSRAPIREALIELCNERILYSIPYYGYKITPLTEEDVANTKSYRYILESGFMREYWEKLTPKALSSLESFHQASVQEAEKSDSIAHWNSNIQFHLAFFEIYGNQYAYQHLRSAMSLQTRAYAQTRWEEYHTQLFYDVPTIHGSILEAIRQNDQDKAVSLLKTDIYSI